jgi:hypothetical protein
MIGPVIPPPIDATGSGDSWDGTGAAAWRERERRQRTVRLMMMFLLMLLLMDGEEQTERRRRKRDSIGLRKKRSPNKTTLEKTLYQTRKEQDERIFTLEQQHPRYQALVGKNRGDVDSEIRKWAMQQADEEKDQFDQDGPEHDPEDDRKVFHYPWNATGFYRGEWTQELTSSTPSLEEKAATEHTAPTTDIPKKSAGTKEITPATSTEPPAHFVTALEMERRMIQTLKERKEQIGVFLLPDYQHLKLEGNETTTETPAQAAAAEIRAHRDMPGPPFLRVTAADLEIPLNEDFKVTLKKTSGRAAFQFYSRAVPAMKELSLIDGFLKLYDSKTVGYSSRRDILMRVRGVILHSIGRISLVSNAAPGRAALVVGLEHDVAEEKPEVAADHEEEQRRKLKQAIANLEPEASGKDIERIRDNVLALFPADTTFPTENVQGSWSSVPTEGSDPANTDDFDFLIERIQSSWLGQTACSLVRAIADSTKPQEGGRRKLNLKSNPPSTPAAAEQVEEGQKKRPIQSKPVNDDDGLSHLVSTQKGKDIVSKASMSSTLSKIMIPYPFVADDTEKSIGTTKPPTVRQMPQREQLLEANAGRCEFEINLDVQDIEWSVGEWRALISRHVKEAIQLDPASVSHETSEGSKEKEEFQAPHRIPHTRMEKSRPKVPALVMITTGSIYSPNCNFKATLNATAIRTDWEHTTGKAINYSFYMMLTCLTQIVVLLRQLLHTQSQSTATRVSLLCIGWQTVLDALLCLCHIYLSLVMQPLFTAFASVAFFKLLIFCVIEMKYMAIIIQARNNSNGGNTTELLRRQVAMLHLRFYVALVASFLAFFYSGEEYRTIYVLALYSFWVPQIIQNIITEAKRPLHNYYIYGVSLSRLVAPLYIFAVPNNFLKEGELVPARSVLILAAESHLPRYSFWNAAVYPDSSPTNILMCELLVLWVGIQAAVLIAQGRYGARFMIPARFLPPKFDYSRPIPASLLPTDTMAADNLSPNSTDALNSVNNPLSTSADRSTSSLLVSRDHHDSPSSTMPDRQNTGVARNRIKGKNRKSESIMMTETVNHCDRNTNSSNPRATLDCVICYNAIDVHNRRGYMLAPCDHIFHRECLIQWMDIKMECPICRTELPSI